MKHIARFENRYGITKEGKVINLANNTELKLRTNPNGYLIASLGTGEGGRHKQLSVHRLVALHFIPNPYEHTQVNHKDGIKNNNHVDNLEWCTASENITHAYKIGIRSGYMSADDKDLLIKRVFNGEKIRDLAIEINRREESLSAMLRKRAAFTGQSAEWKTNMKQRRKEMTIANNKARSKNTRNK